MARIAILGSRGIPNAYGGFEWLAEKLALYFSASGHQVLVSRSSRHPDKDTSAANLDIVNIFDPPIGAAGQFIYDLLSIMKTRKWKPDAILLLGYTSSAIWSNLLPGNCQIVQHMDGLEWKREKYTAPVRRFLRWSERTAASAADILIADHPVIHSYLTEKYPLAQITYIAYGEDDTSVTPEPPEHWKDRIFDLVMARLEPENQIETIIKGWIQANSPAELIIAGSTDTNHGRFLKKKYCQTPNIQFIGSVFKKEHALWLRKNCRYYLHGHSAGGTNPSLIQVLSHHRRVLAHRNPFNQYLADMYGFPTFRNADELSHQLHLDPPKGIPVLRAEHQWNTIYKHYEKILLRERI
jgi:glycosyltransferase involved in cell wall biosynthesis